MTDKEKFVAFKAEVERMHRLFKAGILLDKDFDLAISLIDSMEKEPVDYDKLKEQHHNTLAKETKESLNEFLDEEECNITGIGVREKVTGKLREILDKKDYRERYKRIAESEQFKKTHEGMSIGEVMHIEGEEPVSDDFEKTLGTMLNDGLPDMYLVSEERVKKSADLLLSIAYKKFKQEESVSKDLEEEITKCYKSRTDLMMTRKQFGEIIHHFANWQKKKETIPANDLETELSKYIADHFTIDKEQLDRFGVEEKDYMYSMDKDDMLKTVSYFVNRQYSSKDLEELINTLNKRYPEVSFAKLSRIAVAVAKWKKENLWKPADGDDLPEIDREVVVFTQNFPNDAGIMSVAIAHRPNPDGWDGKSLSTGKVEHYTPKTYDKGGWNIPDVKWWLDVELPKEIEL